MITPGQSHDHGLGGYMIKGLGLIASRAPAR
jgi:hypothetical protein